MLKIDNGNGNHLIKASIVMVDMEETEFVRERSCLSKKPQPAPQGTLMNVCTLVMGWYLTVGEYKTPSWAVKVRHPREILPWVIQLSRAEADSEGTHTPLYWCNFKSLSGIWAVVLFHIHQSLSLELVILSSSKMSGRSSGFQSASFFKGHTEEEG